MAGDEEADRFSRGRGATPISASAPAPLRRAPARDGGRRRERRHRARSRPGARRAQGAADEGRADDGDHPRGPARRLRRTAHQSAIAGAADGRSLRAPAHAGRARPRLARALRRIRSGAGRRRLARPGPSRKGPRRRRPRLQAAVSRHGLDGRSRHRPARIPVEVSPSDGSGDRRQRDRRRNCRALARGARLRARGQADAPLWRDAGRPAAGANAGACSRRFRRAGC